MAGHLVQPKTLVQSWLALISGWTSVVHIWPAIILSPVVTDTLHCSGSWKEKKFKAYNFDAQGIMPTSGHLHPLMKVRAQFRQIFLEMGYAVIIIMIITDIKNPNYLNSMILIVIGNYIEYVWWLTGVIIHFLEFLLFNIKYDLQCCGGLL